MRTVRSTLKVSALVMDLITGVTSDGVFATPKGNPIEVDLQPYKIVNNQLKLEIKICLIKNGYPPQYSPEVFTKVMEQVENFEENN